MDKKTYRQLETDLEVILNRIEAGDYEQLEDILTDHEQAQKLISEMQKRLDGAKATVQKVTTK